jgi:hypothetical protein
MTPKEWARERNMTKGKVIGLKGMMRYIMHLPVTTLDEKASLNLASAHIDRMIQHWDLNNSVSKNFCTKVQGGTNGRQSGKKSTTSNKK